MSRGHQIAKKTGLIGFVGRAFAGRKQFHALAHLAEGVEEATGLADKRIVLLDTQSSVGWDQVDGILIDVPHNVESALSHLPSGMPCVCLLAGADGFSSVVADDENGARQAAEHLLELGHRRIACLMETKPLLARLRRNGYRAALKTAGIEPLPEWSPSPRFAFDNQIGYWAWARDNMTAWLRDGWRESDCTAILAQNDMSAIGAVQALHDFGLRVPQDVSVVGFDSAEICECVTPSITAIEVPLHEIGAAGTRLLLRQIEGDARAPETQVLPTRLQERASTAPPQSGSKPSSNVAVPEFRHRPHFAFAIVGKVFVKRASN